MMLSGDSSPSAAAAAGGNNMCRRHNLFIDIEQLGWQHVIIFPKRFNIFYCSGRCTPTFILRDSLATNHAVLKSLLRSRFGRRVAPQACCVPTTLRALSMLVAREDTLVVRHHKDMVVETCGCR